MNDEQQQQLRDKANRLFINGQLSANIRIDKPKQEIIKDFVDEVLAVVGNKPKTEEK